MSKTEKKQTKKKETKSAVASLNFLSFFQPAPLSPHPDVDRYLPKVLVGSICAVTGLMSMIEIYQNWVSPMLFGETSDEPIEEDPLHGQPAQGQFSRKITVHEKPIPIEHWPRNVDGKLIFQPTYDWQTVPEDCVLPAGLEIQLDTQTGARLARAKKQ
eukprot:UN02085